MPWKVKAHFSTFRALDVTEKLVSAEGQLSLDAVGFSRIVFNGNSPKYLRITNDTLQNWRPLTVAAHCPFSLCAPVNQAFPQVKTRIVYFINCYVNAQFLFMVSSQLKDLRKTGLLTESQCELHVVSSGTSAHREIIRSELNKQLSGVSGVFHDHTEANQFEYPGINKIWEIGQRDEEAYLMYFHARGLSRMKLGRFHRNRQPQEKRLFCRVIGDWRQNLTWLGHVTSADKLGLTCGGNGWVWFNFWWAKSSYIARLEKPKVTDRRHYYEDWLGRFQSSGRYAGEYAGNLNQCLSIASAVSMSKFNLGSDYHPLSGETHLGLPWGYIKAMAVRIWGKWRK